MVRYEKSKKWKTRPQTHLKAPSFRICGLGPRFGAIWPQNLDFQRFGAILTLKQPEMT